MAGLPAQTADEYPVWPGFAINTVFYAVILWGLFAAQFALRRRVRGGPHACRVGCRPPDTHTPGTGRAGKAGKAKT
jgi:hypothetical protein